MAITADHPDRHAIVGGSIYTTGPTPGRDVVCPICLVEMEEVDKTITHCECNNAFHLSCFEKLVAYANPANPTGANSAEFKTAKCPICRGELKAYEMQGSDLPSELAGEQERLRFNAVYQAVTDQPGEDQPGADQPGEGQPFVVTPYGDGGPVAMVNLIEGLDDLSLAHSFQANTELEQELLLEMEEVGRLFGLAIDLQVVRNMRYRIGVEQVRRGLRDDFVPHGDENEGEHDGE